ncbi:MAG: toll/interleukin-1 receptor domain-containing protein [Blastocatellia bacterium]
MKVFLSYAQPDRSLADKVASVLKASGFEVWNPSFDILPGENFAEKIAQALKECEAMVVLLTPEAVASSNVLWEISYALGQPSYAHRLLPVFVGGPDQIPEEKIPWILRHLNGIFLADSVKDEEGIAQIASALHQAA